MGLTFDCVSGPAPDETSLPHFANGAEVRFEVSATFGEGALVGEAIMSDGDVLALTIEPAAQGTPRRAFVLFAAAPPSLFRGSCAAAAHR